MLLESTGMKGQSSLRRVDLETGKVRQRIEVNPMFFA
jgi:glutamine cyclotransferase